MKTICGVAQNYENIESTDEYRGRTTKMCVSQSCPTPGTPQTVAHQTLLFMDFPGKNTGVGSVQFSSVAQSCPTLCDPMNCSMPGHPVDHHLLEFTQTHVHCVGDVIQPSHPLWSPSPPALNFSQHQGLFK